MIKFRYSPFEVESGIQNSLKIISACELMNTFLAKMYIIK